MAPYCAIPRDYLSDNPPFARYGVLGVSTWPIGCDTPSPFSEPFPRGEHATWGSDTPPVPQQYLRDNTWKLGKKGAMPPSAIISKMYCTIWGGGGISYWAAELCNVTVSSYVMCREKQHSGGWGLSKLWDHQWQVLRVASLQNDSQEKSSRTTTTIPDLRKPGLSDSYFWNCSFGLVHGQFLPSLVVIHLPNPGSQCGEPFENTTFFFKCDVWAAPLSS